VRLVPAPAAPAAKVETGSAPDILDWLESHPLPAYARRAAQEIDAAIEAERRAWD
jgi:hypothetical protein